MDYDAQRAWMAATVEVTLTNTEGETVPTEGETVPTATVQWRGRRTA